jgi:ketosteroid isomerase-like protein
MNSFSQEFFIQKRGRVWVIVQSGVLTLILTLCCLVAAEPEASAPGVDATRELQAFLEKWNHAVAAHDVERIRESYADNARFRWFEDGVLHYRSREEIVGALGQFPPSTRIETSLSEIEAEWMGANRMVGSAKFRTRVTMPGQAFEYGGVFTLLFERVGGGWKFLRGHTSTVRSDRTR